MKKLLLPIVSSALLLLVSCKQELSGTINILSQISLRSTKGENVQLAPQYKAMKVKFTGKQKFELQFNDKKFEFKTQQNLKKINSGDRLNLPAGQNGQSYNLNAQYNVDTSSSGLIRSIESCTYSVTEHRCENITQPNSCQQVTECDPTGTKCKTREVCTGGQTVTKCGPVSVNHYGNQEVEYYNRTTTDRLEGVLTHPANGAVVANISAADSESEKIYQYRATCR